MADQASELTRVFAGMLDDAKAEGFRLGYEACLKDTADFLQTRNVILMTPEQHRQTTPSGRAPRGQNKAWVLEAMQNMAATGTAKNVQSYLGSRGRSLPYSSIQNAMFQLENSGELLPVGRGIWRLKTNTPPTDEEGGASMGTD